MAKKVTVNFKGLGRELGRIIGDLNESQSDFVNKTVNDFPRVAENAAIFHYPKALGVISGDLLGEIHGFRGTSKGQLRTLGLRNNMIYAAIQELGGSAGRNHASQIPATHFLSDPLLDVGFQMSEQLLAGVAWP